MDTSTNVSFSRYANIHSNSLTLEDVRRRAPAVFAESAHERTSSSYTFIPTDRILTGLMRAGFVPVDARQARARYSNLHARHVIRLRRRVETIQLRDSVPEIVCLNSHDTTSSVFMWTLICHHRRKYPGNPVHRHSISTLAAMVTFFHAMPPENMDRCLPRLAQYPQ